MSSAPTPSDLDVVSRIAVFRGLKPATIRRVIAPATTIELDEREVLFRQGEPAVAFFIVINGWIKLYRNTIAGDETVLIVFTRGSSFAEAVAFTDGMYP